MKRYTSFGLLSALFLPLLGGCGPDTELIFGTSTSGGGGGGSASCKMPRVDLLIAVDNSRGMGHKQFFLSAAIPNLLQGLVNPPCVDSNGAAAPTQPNSPDSACPDGFSRAFPPQTDIHIGVVSSSIGGHGADSCPDAEMFACNGTVNTSNNDRGRLLSRKDVCSGETIPTYANKSFLAWDPGQTQTPPGEDTLDDGAGGGLVSTIRDMIAGAGEIGCGYESQLESVYRFLADPEPYEKINVVDLKAIPEGIDNVVLSQRANFLRPDSQLIVLMTSDENDCSTKEYGQFFLVNQLRTASQMPFRMPRSRQECATNPNDPCCKSCGQSIGSCPVDPTCGDQSSPALYEEAEDKINLRCWDQKRRFGIDFLYPIDRYVQAFTQTTIANRAGELVRNPIFSDLDPTDTITEIRNPSRVLVAGILGVPWQDIARDFKDAKKGFKNWKELDAPVGGAASGWEVFAGDPVMYIGAKDPLMNESVAPRFGKNPITGTMLASPQMLQGNPINGNEYTAVDDLQYACIFNLPEPLQRDCMDGSCECAEPKNDNPLCDVNPSGSGRTLLVRARALPGLRQLAVLNGLGSQAVVGSVCAAQTENRAETDFGYQPSVRGVIDWMSAQGCTGK